MSKINIIWLAIAGALAVLLLFLFHGLVFSVCYSPYANFISFPILAGKPVLNCLIYTSIFSFLILFAGPILVTLIIYGIYVIIFNREMPVGHVILWLSWAIAVYFLTFQLNFLPYV